jgi:hypothetical protein
MSIFENLRPHRIQHSLVVFYLLSVLPPLSAQTAKELMIDACYNERKDHKNDALWASRVERHTAGHIYLEEEIETVGGPIHRLVSVDGHEPSPSERKQDDDRHRKLMQNPKAQQAMKKNREADQKNVDEILRRGARRSPLRRSRPGSSRFARILHTTPRPMRRGHFTL